LQELLRFTPDRIKLRKLPIKTLEDFVEMVDCSNCDFDFFAGVLFYTTIMLNDGDQIKVCDERLMNNKRANVVRCIRELDFNLYSYRNASNMPLNREKEIQEYLMTIIEDQKHAEPLIRPEILIKYLLKFQLSPLALFVLQKDSTFKFVYSKVITAVDHRPLI
jgi:hypothetical protein